MTTWTTTYTPLLDGLRELPGPLAEYRLCTSDMGLVAVRRSQDPALPGAMRHSYSRLAAHLATLSERLHLLARGGYELHQAHEYMTSLRRAGEDLDVEEYERAARHAYHYATLLPGGLEPEPEPATPPARIPAPGPAPAGLVDVGWGLLSRLEAAAAAAEWEARHE